MPLRAALGRVLVVTFSLAPRLLAPAVPGQTETPSPALLVLDKEDSTLSVIDPATSKTVARIPTGEGPHEVTVSDDGKLAFVSNYGARTPGNTLSVMDLVAQKELRRVDLGALRRPHGISFALGKVWFTAEQNRLIARYEPASNQVDWLLGIGQNGTHMLAFSKDRSEKVRLRAVPAKTQATAVPRP